MEVTKKTTLTTHIPRYVIVKLSKIKEKENLIEARGGKDRYRGTEIIITAHYSFETVPARGQGNDIIKCQQGGKPGYQPRILYPAKLSSTMKTKMKYFSEDLHIKIVRGISLGKALEFVKMRVNTKKFFLIFNCLKGR